MSNVMTTTDESGDHLKEGKGTVDPRKKFFDKYVRPKCTDSDIQRAQNSIISAKISLMTKHPFFGNLICEMPLIDATHRLGTMATDGFRIYYNVNFVNELTIDNVKFGLVHEILHVILDHIGRREHRDPELANIAMDYAVNQIIKDDNLGRAPNPNIIKIFQDDKFKDKTFEEIYDILMKDCLGFKGGQGKQGQSGKGQKQKGSGKGQSGNQSGDDDGSGSGQPQDKNGNGNGDSEFQKAKKKLSEQGECFDSHEEGEDDDEDTYKRIKERIIKSMISSAQNCGAGNIPAGIARIIKSFTESKVDWKALLRMNISSMFRTDYNFSRPNKKSFSSGFVLPGAVPEETVEVVCAIDQSGSINEEQARVFLSEVKGIMDQYKDYKIDVMCFDTKVYNHQSFTPDTSSDIMDYEPMGGGGTYFMCVWDHLKERGQVPKRLIMFTDMYDSGNFGDHDYCETLFVAYGSKITAPFGETIFYED